MDTELEQAVEMTLDIDERQSALYDHAYIDADTILFRGAIVLEKSYIIVTHKVSKKQRVFGGVTEFYGRAKARDGGWIGEVNAKRIKEGRDDLLSVDDFDWEVRSEVIESPDLDKTILEYGLSRIDLAIGNIKRTMRARDYTLAIGGEGNFRYAAAQTKLYKGERAEKPLLYQELRDAFVEKYKQKIEVVPDGWEADDWISIKGWESYAAFRKTGKYPYVLGYIDKDLLMTPCPYFNYYKLEEGIHTPEIMDCARHYGMQLLAGDAIDNIGGLPSVPTPFARKYGIRRGGIGMATAEKILKQVDTPQDVYRVVLEAYRTYYNEPSYRFTSVHGEELEWNWLDFLQENAILLYMNRTAEEVGKYNIMEHLTKMGIDFTDPALNLNETEE